MDKMSEEFEPVDGDIVDMGNRLEIAIAERDATRDDLRHEMAGTAKLEAENAALSSRVKELEEALKEIVDASTCEMPFSDCQESPSRRKEMSAYKFVKKEDIDSIDNDLTVNEECPGFCFVKDYEAMRDLAERLLRERDAYRQVAIEEGTSGEWPYRDVEGAVDAEARRLLAEQEKGK